MGYGRNGRNGRKYRLSGYGIGDEKIGHLKSIGMSLTACGLRKEIKEIKG